MADRHNPRLPGQHPSLTEQQSRQVLRIRAEPVTVCASPPVMPGELFTWNGSELWWCPKYGVVEPLVTGAFKIEHDFFSKVHLDTVARANYDDWMVPRYDKRRKRWVADVLNIPAPTNTGGGGTTIVETTGDLPLQGYWTGALAVTPYAMYWTAGYQDTLHSIDALLAVASTVDPVVLYFRLQRPGESWLYIGQIQIDAALTTGTLDGLAVAYPPDTIFRCEIAEAGDATGLHVKWRA